MFVVTFGKESIQEIIKTASFLFITKRSINGLGERIQGLKVARRKKKGWPLTHLRELEPIGV